MVDSEIKLALPGIIQTDCIVAVARRNMSYVDKSYKSSDSFKLMQNIDKAVEKYQWVHSNHLNLSRITKNDPIEEKIKKNVKIEATEKSALVKRRMTFFSGNKNKGLSVDSKMFNIQNKEREDGMTSEILKLRNLIEFVVW